MSGIAKPLVHFTGSENTEDFIPVDHIVDVSKLDIPAGANQPAADERFLIVVNLVYPNSATKEKKISFTGETARNTAFTNLKAAISTAVAS